MPSNDMSRRRRRPAAIAASLAVAVISLGTVAVLAPGVNGNAYFLLRKARPLESTASSVAIEASALELHPRESVCLDAVTITSNSRIAQFSLLRSAQASGAAPPLDLRLSAPGYADDVQLSEGSYGGTAGSARRASRTSAERLCFWRRRPLRAPPRARSSREMGNPSPATWCSGSTEGTACREQKTSARSLNTYRTSPISSSPCG
jgi:hypothetical protein